MNSKTKSPTLQIEWKNSDGEEYTREGNPKPLPMKLFRLGYWMLGMGLITPVLRTQLRQQGLMKSPLSGTYTTMMYMVKDSRWHGKALEKWK